MSYHLIQQHSYNSLFNVFEVNWLFLGFSAGVSGIWSGGICLLWWAGVHGALQRSPGRVGTGGAKDGEPVDVFVLILFRGFGDSSCDRHREESAGQQWQNDPAGHRKCCCCRSDVFFILFFILGLFLFIGKIKNMLNHLFKWWNTLYHVLLRIWLLCVFSRQVWLSTPSQTLQIGSSAPLLTRCPHWKKATGWAAALQTPLASFTHSWRSSAQQPWLPLTWPAATVSSGRRPDSYWTRRSEGSTAAWRLEVCSLNLRAMKQFYSKVEIGTRPTAIDYVY